MKLLLIKYGNDYDAVDFENVYHGQLVKDLISKVESGETLVGEGGELSAEVITIPETTLSNELIDFIRNEVQDYEHTKHTNFYIEGASV